MTVCENLGRGDASNVVFDGKWVVQYQKGVRNPPPEMRYIDYGLLKLDRGLSLTTCRRPGQASFQSQWRC